MSLRTLWVGLVCSVLLVSSSTFALTPKAEKGVEVLRSPSLVYESPDWFTPFPLEEAPEEIDYWLSVLPYEEDRNEDMYIVMPTLGLIAPIVMVPEDTQDFADMVNGREIEINNYLTEGVMHYPNSGLPGEEGNSIIFGHSNFFKNGEGRYKTIFADIMNLDPIVQDEIRVYTKQDNNAYELQKFAIEESYETHPGDVDILRPSGGKELTVFACTNGLEGRWILKARLIEDDEILVPYEMKYRVAALEDALEAANALDRQATIVAGMEKIEEIQNGLPEADRTMHDRFKNYLLEYIEERISLHY